MRPVLSFVAVALLSACGFNASGNASDDDAALDEPDAGETTDPTDVDAGEEEPGGPFPIFLAHGAFGTDAWGPIDYFYGIREELEAAGRTVYAVRVDAIQTPEVRGAQLAAAIEAALAETGAPKVVIIGHSQGGLDARWVANHHPDRVAAVVTIATPHRGSPVADVALGFTPGDNTAAMNYLADLFGQSTSGSSSDFAAQWMSMSAPGSAAFNAAVLDAPGVQYFSIGGRSAYAPASACPSTGAPAFMHTWDDELDPMRASLLGVGGIVAAASLPATPVQDGLVTVPSMQWGTWLGCVPADHLDQICQVAGQGPGLFNDFDCLAFWRGLEGHLSSLSL